MPKDEDILQLVRFYCFFVLFFVFIYALREFYFQIFCSDFVVGNMSSLETSECIILMRSLYALYFKFAFSCTCSVRTHGN